MPLVRKTAQESLIDSWATIRQPDFCVTTRLRKSYSMPKTFIYAINIDSWKVKQAIIINALTQLCMVVSFDVVESIK